MKAELFKESDARAIDVNGCAWISIRVVNETFQAFLAKGRVVYGFDDDTGAWTFERGKTEDGDIDTHQALLVNVEPIERDSAEKILRDLIETADSLPDKNPLLSVRYYVDRARALLKEGK